MACEDTRRTRVLLDRYGVQARLVSYHEHNERARAAELVERMRAGAVVALVSDAGMPLVSDPGYVLVRACVAAGLPVEVLPGPSAAITALVASGLPADEWRFAGFLPRKKGELRGCSVGAGDARGVRVAAPGAGDAGGAGRARSRARGRGLPRADQGARGGGARDARRSWPRATPTAPPRGEVVLVVGPRAAAPAGRRADPAGARRAAPAGGRRRAHPRKAAAASWRS